jgi:GTP cyclohydrolase II
VRLRAERDYTSAAQMLHALGASRIGLLSNNPDKGALGLEPLAEPPRRSGPGPEPIRG